MQTEQLEKRGPGRPRKNNPLPPTAIRTLEAGEAEKLNEELSRAETMLKATEEFSQNLSSGYAPAVSNEMPIDKEKLKGKVQHLRGVLERETPRKITDQTQRAKVLDRMKQLQERFQPYLETWEEIGLLRADKPEFRKAVKKALDRQNVEHLIREWKELAKSLEPDDPEFYSLDRIRKER